MYLDAGMQEEGVVWCDVPRNAVVSRCGVVVWISNNLIEDFREYSVMVCRIIHALDLSRIMLSLG